MVGLGVLSLALLSITIHKPYIIKRQSICHTVFCVFFGSDGNVLAIRKANKYYLYAWFSPLSCCPGDSLRRAEGEASGI